MVSSSANNIGSAALNLMNVTDNSILMQLSLTKECSGALVTNHTSIPAGSFLYHLVGRDTDGVPFTYDTKKRVKFELPHARVQSSDVSFSSSESSMIEIERDEISKINFNFTNNWMYDAYFNFTGHVPNGFISIVKPPYALVVAGGSLRVEMLIRVVHTSISGGTFHNVSVSASSCGSEMIQNASKTVVIVRGLKTH